MNKKIYESPIVDIVKMEVETIVTLSVQNNFQSSFGKTSINGINSTNSIDF